jgi:archaellum component FlaF (FlaF/FlaG flagellin family)
MRKIFTLISIMAFAGMASAQPWTYDFGTSTGSHSTASAILSSDVSSYLPVPQTNGGTARTRVGSGSGSFNLDNPGTTLGSETEFRMVAPTSASLNKFSVFDYTGGKQFAIKFYIRFDGGASGIWTFVCGDGTMYSDNNALSSAQVFAGMRFTFAASDAITAQHRTGATWASLSSNPFSQKNNFKVELYGNNGTTTINYTYGGVQSIAANRYDIWVDGVLIGDDITKGALGNDVNIDSWLFFGESSSGNVATAFIDDISYSNSVESHGPLPISLVKFSADKFAEKVKVQWTTATEINNDKFVVERSADGENFEFVSELRGAGNSRELNAYEVVDAKPLKGTSYYRLTQYDFNGASETFAPVAVNMGKGVMSLEQIAGSAEQGAGSMALKVFSPTNTNARLAIRDLSGRTLYSEEVVLLEGYQHFNINTSELSSGIYLLHIISGKESVAKKMMIN